MNRRSIFLLLSFSILFATHPADEKVREGVGAFYNYETEFAVSVLKNTREKYPNHSGVHLIWAASKWLNAQYNGTTESAYQTLDTDLNEIIPVYKSLMEKNPDDQEVRLYYGSALGLMARVNLGKKEWIKTLSNAYRGFRIIQDVAEKDPTLVDANLPIGIVEYYAGMSNSLIQFAAGLFGLEASKDAGLEKIRLAAEEGPWSWTEASAVITFIYLWSDRNSEQAERFSKKLVQAYPNNFYYRILFTESLLRRGKIEEAKKSLEILVEAYHNLTEIQKKWFYGYLQFEWALFYHLTGKDELAIQEVDLAIHSYRAELDIILGEAWLLKGKIHDLNIQREEALKAYKSCLELDNMTQAMKDAETFLQQPYLNAK